MAIESKYMSRSVQALLWTTYEARRTPGTRAAGGGWMRIGRNGGWDRAGEGARRDYVGRARQGCGAEVAVVSEGGGDERQLDAIRIG